MDSPEQYAPRRRGDAFGCPLSDGIQIPKWKFWKRRRYIVTFMAFLGFFNVFSLRVNLSVAIAAMTSKHTTISENGTAVREAEFDWDSKLQGHVLGAYFYGYITTQILGGWLAARIGGNRLFGVGVGVTAALTLLTPLIARKSVYSFIAIRVIEGVFEGVSYPSMHDIWAHWAPPLERSRLTTIGYSGSYVGIVVGMTLSGILSQHAGWPSVFYVFGSIGIVWFVAWWLLVQRSPEHDRFIDPRELDYLKRNLGICLNGKYIQHPWKEIFYSLPVWAVVVANFCSNWGFYTLVIELPLFMKETLQFDIEATGFLSAMPYLVVAITMQVSGQIADSLLINGILTTTQVRKLFCCGAFIIQSLFMTLAAFLATPTGTLTCLTVAVGMGAFAEAGFFVNHLDLAPQHASVLMGIANTAGTLPGIISPTLTGYLVTQQTIGEWRTVFHITSSIYVVGSLFYGVFASGNRQRWAQYDESEEDARRRIMS